jgi:hypothetical protein
MRVRGWSAASAVVLAGVLCGCGISTSGGPQAIPPNQIPNAAPPTTAPTCPVPVTLVFLDELNNAAPTGALGCVGRPGKLDDIVDQLLLGPTDTQLLSGLATSIPPNTTLLGLSVSKQGMVTVDLSAEFISGSSTQQEQEVEQVVYTVACALRPTGPTTPIAFEVEGSAQAVPVANGTTVAAPVTAAGDYGFSNATCVT